VRFKAPFAVAKYEVTQELYQVVAGATPSKWKGPRNSVEMVNWDEANAFCTKATALLHKNKLLPAGEVIRLPSEAEWEYAARGGSTAKYWWGNQAQPGLANCKGCNEPYDPRQPLKVGSFLPNPFGLYDMGGGVDQWVEDCWHKNYQGAPVDGSAWVGGDCTSHVIRSGSWKNDARYVRPANRDSYDTNVRYPTHGFRVALSP